LDHSLLAKGRNRHRKKKSSPDREGGRKRLGEATLPRPTKTTFSQTTLFDTTQQREEIDRGRRKASLGQGQGEGKGEKGNPSSPAQPHHTPKTTFPQESTFSTSSQQGEEIDMGRRRAIYWTGTGRRERERAQTNTGPA
jgi:hypothetical protein